MSRQPSYHARTRAIHPRRVAPRVMLLVAAMLGALPGAALAQQAPTAEDVFRSVGDNVSRPIDGMMVLVLAAGGVTIIGGLIALGRRQQQQAVGQAVNNQGKLLREVTRGLGLDKADVRKLRAMADQLAERGTPVESPLTLLLCPSLIERSAEQKERSVEQA